MPPKKKPEKKTEGEEGPAGYNIAIMSLDQLKQYTRLIEEEIEDMRRHCNFSQKMEGELVELVKISEDDLRHSEDSMLLKDVELERMKLKVLKHLREEKQWPKYMEHVSCIRAEKLSTETCNRLEQEETRNFQETSRLKRILQEKDRETEALRIRIEIARKETQENNEEYLKAMDDHQKNLLEQAIRKLDNVFEEAQKEFMEDKENLEYKARDEKIRDERSLNNLCEAFKQKLHDYYKDVTRQDLDTIKKLKLEIKKVQEHLQSCKFLHQETQNGNKNLNTVTPLKIPETRFFGICPFKYGMCPLKIIEGLQIYKRTQKLTFENQILEKQIKNVMEQTYNLRRQFTLALKKVRQSAEIKTNFLEKKLNFILVEELNESDLSVTESEALTSVLDDSSEQEISSDTVDNW